MKKIICICICIFLSSGCDKLLSHGRPANDVVEDTGSEAEPPLPSNTSKASVPEPSNTPAPTPEPQPSSGSVVSSDLISWHWWFPTINLSNSVLYWTLNAVVYALALALAVSGVYYGGYKPLYRFASFNPVLIDKLRIVEKKDITEDYKQCYSYDGCNFFDCVSKEYIDAILVRVYIQLPNLPHPQDYYYYKPNSSKLKPLKTLLRKIFGIETPVSLFPYFGKYNA